MVWMLLTIYLCKLVQRGWLDNIQNGNYLFRSVSWQVFATNGRISEIGPSKGDKESVEWTSCTHILIHASLGEELEEFKLSECPQAKQGMFKRQDLLDSDLSTGGYMPR